MRHIEAGITINSLPPTILPFETNASGDGLFWARWYQQYSKVVWAGSPDVRSSSPPGPGWELANFVANYDVNGKLTRYRYCSESELKKCFQMIESISSEHPDRSPLEFAASRDDFFGTITVSPGHVVLKGERGGTSPRSLIIAQYPASSVKALPAVSTNSTQTTVSLIIVLEGGPGPDWVDISASPREARSLIEMLSSPR